LLAYTKINEQKKKSNQQDDQRKNMSAHEVKIIEITEILLHGNADSLEIIPTGGWQSVVRKGSFKVGDKAIFIEPDYMVDLTRSEFNFLARGKDVNVANPYYRLRAIKLRGELSYGLLIPVPEALSNREIGNNVIEDLSVKRYVPKEKGTRAVALNPELYPKLHFEKFDLENVKNYKDAIADDEYVICSEKLHGTSSRFVFTDDQLYIGSRNLFVENDGLNNWSKALVATPEIETWCRQNPGMVLYGEVYGDVQSLKYGCTPGQVKFLAFAALCGKNYQTGHATNLNVGQWLDIPKLMSDNLPCVPVLFQGTWGDAKKVCYALVEQDSQVVGAPKGHLSEGFVVVPVVERTSRNLGRVALKHVSDRYTMSEH
jgi:RNA ligase (TIGR02306 family)